MNATLGLMTISYSIGVPFRRIPIQTYVQAKTMAIIQEDHVASPSLIVEHHLESHGLGLGTVGMISRATRCSSLRPEYAYKT